MSAEEQPLSVQPGLGDQLLFITSGDHYGAGRRVAWLTRPEILDIAMFGDRDRAILRAHLTLALERLDALEADIGPDE